MRVELHRDGPPTISLPKPLNANQPWRAGGSALICMSFSDKFNLKIQLNGNQQSKPTRKSLASLRARRATSDPKGVRKCGGPCQGSEDLLLCPQHELRPKPPKRAPSQLPPFPKMLLVRQRLAGGRTLVRRQEAWVLVLFLLLVAGWARANHCSWSCHCLILIAGKEVGGIVPAVPTSQGDYEAQRR